MNLMKEMTSIDNVMKTKLQSYNLAKGSLQQMQRKKTHVSQLSVYLNLLNIRF